MKSFTYIIVAEDRGVYNKIKQEISQRDPDSEIRQAGSVQEGAAILDEEKRGVLITDLGSSLFEEAEKADRKGSGDGEERAGCVLPRDGKEIPAPAVERPGGTGRPHGAQDHTVTAGSDLRGLKHFIRMHLAEELSLVRLADQAALSPNYLSSLFKRKEGISLKQFIERSRIQRAAYLILTEDSQMNEIAAKVGYRHTSYFCRSFRKYYGTTPLQFRKSGRSLKF